eukprot:scaffold173369_cov30-Prasinocladus_malaysianus.AAC.1
MPVSVASMSFAGSALSTLPEDDDLLEVFQRYASFGTQDATALVSDPHSLPCTSFELPSRLYMKPFRRAFRV